MVLQSENYLHVCFIIINCFHYHENTVSPSWENMSGLGKVQTHFSLFNMYVPKTTLQILVNSILTSRKKSAHTFLFAYLAHTSVSSSTEFPDPTAYSIHFKMGLKILRGLRHLVKIYIGSPITRKDAVKNPRIPSPVPSRT